MRNAIVEYGIDFAELFWMRVRLRDKDTPRSGASQEGIHRAGRLCGKNTPHSTAPQERIHRGVWPHKKGIRGLSLWEGIHRGVDSAGRDASRTLIPQKDTPRSLTQQEGKARWVPATRDSPKGQSLREGTQRGVRFHRNRYTQESNFIVHRVFPRVLQQSYMRL